MKKFFKNNLSMIIIVAVLLLVVSILGAAIYITSNQKEPEIIIKDNILVEYRGSSNHVEVESDITIISTRAFEEKISLTKVSFQENSKVKSIGHEAFAGCTSLVDIVLPKGLEKIGKRAFSNCAALEAIIIPEGVTTIEDGAFEGCKNLKSISLPSSLISLGEGVFNNCASLEKVTTNSKNYEVEGNILYGQGKTILIKYFNKSEVASFIVPENVSTISSYAFQGSTLTSVVINENVKQIGKSIFAECEKLENITIPFLGPNEDESSKLAYFFGENPKNLKKVTILGGYEISSIAFRNCSNLVEVTLPNTIKLIGVNAFYGLKKLVAVNIPSSVRIVENGAFEGCSKLLTITVNKTESSTSSWGNWNPDGCQVVYE